MTNPNPTPDERVEIRVTGRVQGVAFRWHTRRQAHKLELVGSVRNLTDGSVAVVAEGPRSALEVLCDWVSIGPDHARIDSREVSWVPAQGIYTDFQIIG